MVTRRDRVFLVFLALLVTTHVPLAYADIAGRASVIDGDTIEIHGQRVRLYGVDAPESAQICLTENKEWRCGQQAALALDRKIAGRPVTCTEKDRDRYGRMVAVCRLGGEDLNAWLVAAGWALAYRQYSMDYAEEEKSARGRRNGLWQGLFVPPWDWRRGKRAQEVTQKGSDCTIKGNINSKGERVYHVPSGQFYGRSRINQSEGERWFCSEAEARAAGWRRSRR